MTRGALVATVLAVLIWFGTAQAAPPPAPDDAGQERIASGPPVLFCPLNMG